MAITTAKEAANIMNQTLKTVGYEYQIDVSSGDTMEAGFKTIGAYPPSQLNALLEQANIILIHRNYGTMFDSSKNQTRKFWRDAITNGGGIEDIYHKIIEPVKGFWAEDFAGLNEEQSKTLGQEVAADLFRYHKSEILKRFHTKTNHFSIPLSISRLEISKIFTPTGFANYIDVQLANIQWSAEIALQKYVIANIELMVNNKDVVYETGHNLNTPNGVTTLVESIKTMTDAFGQPYAEGNKAQVTTLSPENEVYLVTTPEYWNRIKTRGFANAYNLGEYETKNQLIMLPRGTSLGIGPNGKEIGFLLLDKRAIVMAIRYWNMMPQIIPNTDYMNYFLKVEFLEGYNEFFNAVAFECDLGNFTDGAEAVLACPVTGGSTETLSITDFDGNKFPEYYNSDLGESYILIPKNAIVKFEQVGSSYNIYDIGTTNNHKDFPGSSSGIATLTYPAEFSII